ncbi:MAG: PD-(D/E)XK nuclease-like domain-containing protein, partial [Alphaproteobacteria bacterium]
DAFNDTYKANLKEDIFKGLLKTVDDLKAFLDSQGVDYKKSARKDELIKLAKPFRPNIWDCIKADYEDERITASDNDLIKVRNIKEALARSEYKNFFSGGIPEITVLFKFAGIDFKARIDYLKPTEILDLKTFSIRKGKMAKKSIHDAIGSFGYGLQARIYVFAINEAKRYIERDMIYGFTDKQKKILRQVANHREDHGFKFLFISSTHAPVIHAKNISGHTNYYNFCAGMLSDALKQYKIYDAKFAKGEPWCDVIAEEELQDDDIPAWVFY